jgi:hypothetical protein
MKVALCFQRDNKETTVRAGSGRAPGYKFPVISASFDKEEYRLTMWTFYLPERVWVQGQIYLALTTIKVLSCSM